MVRDAIRRVEAAKPAVRQVEMNLLTEAVVLTGCRSSPQPMASGSAAQDRLMGDPCGCRNPQGVPGCGFPRNMLLTRELVEQGRLRLLPRSHHRKPCHSLRELNPSLATRSRKSSSTKSAQTGTFAAMPRECAFFRSDTILRQIWRRRWNQEDLPLTWRSYSLASNQPRDWTTFMSPFNSHSSHPPMRT